MCSPARLARRTELQTETAERNAASRLLCQIYFLFDRAERKSNNQRIKDILTESNHPASAFRTHETLPAMKNDQNTIANTVNARYLTSFTKVNFTTIELTKLAISCENFQQGA